MLTIYKIIVILLSFFTLSLSLVFKLYTLRLNVLYTAVLGLTTSHYKSWKPPQISFHFKHLSVHLMSLINLFILLHWSQCRLLPRISSITSVFPLT